MSIESIQQRWAQPWIRTNETWPAPIDASGWNSLMLQSSPCTHDQMCALQARVDAAVSDIGELLGEVKIARAVFDEMNLSKWGGGGSKISGWIKIMNGEA